MYKFNFPLPRASQEHYTKWYNHQVTNGVLKNKTIVWAAQELPCRFRSDTVKDIIGHHVFILRLNDTFHYAIKLKSLKLINLRSCVSRICLCCRTRGWWRRPQLHLWSRHTPERNNERKRKKERKRANKSGTQLLLELVRVIEGKYPKFDKLNNDLNKLLGWEIKRTGSQPGIGTQHSQPSIFTQRCDNSSQYATIT